MAVKSSVLQDCQTLQGVNIVMSSYMVNSLLKKTFSNNVYVA